MFLTNEGKGDRVTPNRRIILATAILLGGAACGEYEADTDRLPEQPVLETVVPGIIFLRGPDGEVLPGNAFESAEQVHLVGTGLNDGPYYFQITDGNCESQLAGPSPRDVNVPDTADEVVQVENRSFGPRPIAPFLATLPADAFYTVYMTPVTLFSEDPTVGCFGFGDLDTLTSEFRLDLEEEPLDPGEPVETDPIAP